jgi:hypothetical protein
MRLPARARISCQGLRATRERTHVGQEGGPAKLLGLPDELRYREDGAAAELPRSCLAKRVHWRSMLVWSTVRMILHLAAEVNESAAAGPWRQQRARAP